LHGNQIYRALLWLVTTQGYVIRDIIVGKILSVMAVKQNKWLFYRASNFTAISLEQFLQWVSCDSVTTRAVPHV
jgi:hypothetical protein